MSVDAANTMSIVGGTLWVDRHLHKNGGSTMREVMLRNEEAGNCVYYGYTQTREGWDRLMSYMRSINSSTASLPRVCIEAHASQASAEFTSRRIPDLLRLRAIYTQWAVPIRVVLTVRVREPLSYYISFYRWRVAGLQRGGNIIRLSPKKSVYQPLGTDFLGWSPPNLQSIGLLHGDVELFAGLKAGGWPGVRNATRRPHPYWSAHQSFEAQHYTDLLTTLGHYDVVAPLEAFDEHLLLIAERTGIKPLQAVEHAKVVPEAQGMRGVRLKDLQVCPNMSVASPNVLVPPPTSLGLCPPLLTALGATCQVARAASPNVWVRADRSAHRARKWLDTLQNMLREITEPDPPPSFQNVKLWVGTWNMGNAMPDGDQLKHWLETESDKHDVYAIGLQVRHRSKSPSFLSPPLTFSRLLSP